jgi:hypothetical protein
MVKWFLKNHWFTLLFGALGVLELTPWVEINFVALTFFVLAALPALLPLCSRYLSTFKAGKDGIEATFSATERFEPKSGIKIEELPERETTPISNADILAAFKKIPEFRDADLSTSLAEVRYHLLRNGVATKAQLDELVSSTEILEVLRQIYIRVLRRDPEKPLDPVAVAVWGSALYVLGLNEEVVRAIGIRLRYSPEYREKVARGLITP